MLYTSIKVLAKVHPIIFICLHITYVVKDLLRAQWVKFICGASNHDVSLIRNFCYVYTAAGVDCIDISAVVQYSILFLYDWHGF